MRRRDPRADAWRSADPEPPAGLRILKRAATSTVAILTLITVIAVVVVGNIDFGKGKPPAGAADMSTNELMRTLSGYTMDPAMAQAQAHARQRAYERQLALERQAAKDAKERAAKARAEARRRAWEALKRKMSHNPTAAQNKAVAKQMSARRGWSRCWGSLETMWNHESGWNEMATNPSSGAYGIPQALPGSKMSSAGPDWRRNAMTQISWGLGYIAARYRDPCRAWNFWQAHHWY